jgi:hypothetical protein
MAVHVKLFIIVAKIYKNTREKSARENALAKSFV